MFYWLYEQLAAGGHVPVLNVLKYITFRTGMAIFTAQLVVVLMGSRFIRWMQAKQGKGQPIRAEGIDIPIAASLGLLTARTAKKLKEIRNNILSRPGGTKIPAISNDRVYVLSVDATVGPDLPVGIASIAKILHPEIDIDPDQVYEEYLELLGVSWPEGRTFVYPDVG